MSTRICSFDGCVKPHQSNGLCVGHVKQRQLGKELKPLKFVLSRNLSIEERLDFYLDKSGDCWVWTGRLDRCGYGKLDINRVPRTSHRLAYETWVGTIPEEMTIHHKCANRACCNPDHLELATDRENVGEMFARKAYEAKIARLELQVELLERELLIRDYEEISSWR